MSSTTADVVVLNTCCIRENADTKLYGHLGHLKSEKARRPDLQIVVGGCLAQKDRDTIRERAPHVDVVFGTHNVHRAAALLEEARTGGPVVEIWEATDPEAADAFPSALPVRREVPWAGWVTIQIGCDNTCAFCIVPSVRGQEISRAFDDIVAEVEAAAADGVSEVTLLGQNVNSYGRDLTRRRPLFAELLRATGAVDGHPPGPLHQPAPEGPPARDDRGHGRPRRRCASTCTCRCSRAATGCSPRCTGATPPIATSSASPRPAPPFPIWRSPPT